MSVSGGWALRRLAAARARSVRHDFARSSAQTPPAALLALRQAVAHWAHWAGPV